MSPARGSLFEYFLPLQEAGSPFPQLLYDGKASESSQHQETSDSGWHDAEGVGDVLKETAELLSVSKAVASHAT